MSRIDSRSPAPRSQALLHSAVTLAAFVVVAGNLFVPPATMATLIWGGIFCSVWGGRLRRTMQDRVCGVLALLSSITLLAVTRESNPWALVVAVGLAAWTVGWQAGAAIQESMQLLRSANLFAACFGGIAIGSLVVPPLFPVAGWRIAPDMMSVALAAAAAFWFRIGRAQRERGLAVVIALIGVAILLLDLRSRNLPAPDAFFAEAKFSMATSWELVASLLLLIGSTSTAIYRRGAFSRDARLFAYLIFAALGAGVIVGTATVGLQSFFGQSSGNSEGYWRQAQGVLALGAVFGTWWWQRWERGKVMRWLAWLLGFSIGVPVVATFAPGLVLMDVVMGWSAPWPWLGLLLIAGFTMGPMIPAALARISADGRTLARVCLVMAGSAATVGWILSIPMSRSIGPAKTASLGSSAVIIAMLAVSAWDRVTIGKR
jgi:hypothetical protein